MLGFPTAKALEVVGGYAVFGEFRRECFQSLEKLSVWLLERQYIIHVLWSNSWSVAGDRKSVV